LGFVSNELFKKEHNTVITDLEPSTTYEYELVAYGHDGHKTVLKEGRFQTQNAPDTQAPTNVTNLKAVVDGSSVKLTWVNPSDPDFAYVRVVRNHLFYPTDPFDGFTSYLGAGASYVDRNALLQKDVQYYTVFSYDTLGNISSGAVVRAIAENYVAPISVPSPRATSTETIDLNFKDIEFLQDKTRVDASSISADLPLLIRIPYAKLPEHLKTITVTLQHPTDVDASFSFILKINKDKTCYEATIGALEASGAYPTIVSIFNYQTDVLHTIDGVLQVEKTKIDESLFGIPLTTHSSPVSKIIFWALILLLLLLLYVLFLLVHGLNIGKGTYESFDTSRFVVSAVLIMLLGAGTFALFSLEGLVWQGAENNVSLASVVTSAIHTNGLRAGLGALFAILCIVILIASFKKK